MEPPTNPASGSDSSLDFHKISVTDHETLSSSSASSESTTTTDGNFTEDETSTCSEPSLQSLANFITSNMKPSGGKYNAYATSYIATVMPNLEFYSDDTDSFRADPPPFSDAVKIKEYQVQEKRRKELGQSSRHGKIIPQSKAILKEIDRSTTVPKCGKNQEDTRAFLFHKARQWCEINKALFIDNKYPKIEPRVMRHKYSDEHRTACRKTKKKVGLSDKTRIFHADSIHTFPLRLTNLEEQEEHRQSLSREKRISRQIRDEESNQICLKQQLNKIFEEIKPIVDSTVTNPWQLNAKKTAGLKPQRVKKPPFKRTEYPPISKTQKIAQLRKLLPPPKAFEMETDYLSGIWEPQLEIDEFDITPPNYDDNKVGHHEGEEVEGGVVTIDWFQMHEAKKKCNLWLAAIPDNYL